MSSYDDFAETFARSRDRMKWADSGYCLDCMRPLVCIDTPRILDIGAGSGRHIAEIQLRWGDTTYVGIDISSGMLCEARRRYPNNDFRQLDMRSVGTLGEIFDVVCFFASFHHIDTIDGRIETLKGLRCVLHKDTIIGMTNWNLLSPDLLARYGSMRTSDQDFAIKIGQHSRQYHAFTRDELKDIIEMSGYDIIDNIISPSGRNIITIFKDLI